jgi:hypothetical protein
MEHRDADGIGRRILPRWEAPPPRWLSANRRLQQYCFAIMDYDESRELSYRMQGDGQIWGSNMAFRREIFDDIGYFDTDLGRAGEKLYRGGEEQLFVNRALQHGRQWSTTRASRCSIASAPIACARAICNGSSSSTGKGTRARTRRHMTSGS